MKGVIVNDVIYTRYKELACASIELAVKDFIESETMSDYSFYCWVMDCDYFNFLNIDREYFYVKCLKLKEANKNKKYKRKRSYREYGKREQTK